MLKQKVIDAKIKKLRDLYESVKNSIPDGRISFSYYRRYTSTASCSHIENILNSARNSLRDNIKIARENYVLYLNGLYKALKKYA